MGEDYGWGKHTRGDGAAGGQLKNDWQVLRGNI